MRMLLRFLFGWFFVTFPRSFTEEVINLLLENRASSWGYIAAGEEFSLSVGRKGYKILQAAFSGTESGFHFKQHGLPVYIKELLRRPGLILGGALALLVFLLGTTLVWDVRIEGNVTVPDAVIEKALSDAGLSVGMRRADVKRQEVALSVLENEKSIAYLALNLHGGVAYVKVMESASPPPAENRTGGANLVASCDALIDSLAVRRGEVCVRAGQVVKKGELLVSGVTDAHGGNRLLYADGEVYGQVSERFTIKVPLKNEVSLEKDEKTVGFLINFFGKSINIFGGGGNLPLTCGTIYNWERYMLPGGVALPFSFARVTVRESENEVSFLERSEAVSYAVRLAKERLARELKDGELLSRTLDGVFTEDAYILTCEYTCVCNIAKTEEFTVN